MGSCYGRTLKIRSYFSEEKRNIDRRAEKEEGEIIRGVSCQPIRFPRRSLPSLTEINQRPSIASYYHHVPDTPDSPFSCHFHR